MVLDAAARGFCCLAFASVVGDAVCVHITHGANSSTCHFGSPFLHVRSFAEWRMQRPTHAQGAPPLGDPRSVMHGRHVGARAARSLSNSLPSPLTTQDRTTFDACFDTPCSELVLGLAEDRTRRLVAEAQQMLSAPRPFQGGSPRAERASAGMHRAHALALRGLREETSVAEARDRLDRMALQKPYD